VVPHYLRLLLAPVALSADYEPQVISTASGPTPEAALGILLLAGYVAAIVVSRRRRPELAFALVWIGVAIAPVSNLLFVSGVTLSERSLYLPSVGAVIALGVAFDAWHGRRHTVVAVATALVLLGAVRTWTRTPVWRDDRTYLVTLLEDHPESYRAHWVAGRVHRAAGRLDAAEREFALARRIYPRSARVYAESAALAEQMGDAAAARRLRDSAAVLR
jgi:protein O-mannosyl-transferase